MLMSESRIACALVLTVLASAADGAERRYNFGRPATEAEIAAWNIDVGRDGKNLPAGSGSVERGRALFNAKCAACHGEKGEGGLGDRLVGGQGSLNTPKPVKTVGSYWPYATTLFDYIRRAMPLNSPQSLDNEDVYAVAAFILYLNGLVPETATLDATSLLAIKMPNRNGFVSDPRPDIKIRVCMRGC